MEVCVDSIESAINAASAGAIRLELCSALSCGGLTPTIGFLNEVKSAVDIPVFTMIRIHGCSDFVFTETEIEAMLYDAKSLKTAGADGFVFGALTASGDIDVAVCEKFVQTVFPLPVTFHRAFDVSRDPFNALELIIHCGYSRILTSGQEVSAENGISLIKMLISESKGRIIIMPGSGITKDNIRKILIDTGVKEFHGSGKKLKQTNHTKQTDVKMGLGSSNYVTSSDIIREIVSISQTITN